MLNETSTEVQADLLCAKLDATRIRLEFALERKGQRLPWPEAVLEAERIIETRSAEAVAAGHALPVRWLHDRLGLSSSEMAVLWTLAAHELDPSARALLRALNTEALADPTTEAIRQAVYGPLDARDAWRELAVGGSLRRLGLIERTDTDVHAPPQRQTWRVSSRVIAMIHGDEEPDEEITRLLVGASSTSGMGGQGIEAAATDMEAIASAVNASVANGSGVVIVHGSAGTGRRSLLLAALAAQNLCALVIDAAAIAKDAEVAKRELRLIERECRLLGMVPLLRNLEALAAGPGPETPDRLVLVESELGELRVYATTSRRLARRWQRAPRTIELAPLTGAQREALWARALPMATAGDASTLATMYPIAPALMGAAARVAIETAAGGPMTPDHIIAGLRVVLDDRLAGLASRVNVTQGWRDLVLPTDQMVAVVDLIGRIRSRRRVYEEWGFGGKVGKGLGVSALFSGPPGTGKTMAAGLIACELGTEIYQVDISKIVSKWIGETEKNLATLFDAAEAGHAILLFDEADTIFGKRTDVKSSNDRHANQETNYLLQRLESFTGICILTTNHDAAIDEAFRRRLSAHVQFPMPEAEERARLWARLLPQTAPVAKGIDFARLARDYEMSGGYIKNAVLRAAFMAADADGAITAAHLARGAQLEYQAMGRITSSIH